MSIPEGYFAIFYKEGKSGTIGVRFPEHPGWMAYLLRHWREKSRLTQKQLATKLGISYQAYQRMERPGRSNVTVHALERLAEALGGELILDMRLKRKAG